jgi:hypothetical protein
MAASSAIDAANLPAKPDLSCHTFADNGDVRHHQWTSSMKDGSYTDRANPFSVNVNNVRPRIT